MDLIYYKFRLDFNGNNSIQSPWNLGIHLPKLLINLINLEEYKSFANKINLICRWSKSEKTTFFILQYLYYPLCWYYSVKVKKRKFTKVYQFVSYQKPTQKLWKADVDASSMQMKLGKSDDYTLLFIDFLDYSSPKFQNYFKLKMNMIIKVSGEGSFIKPFYLYENDSFLQCMFVVINR